MKRLNSVLYEGKLQPTEKRGFPLSGLYLDVVSDFLRVTVDFSVCSSIPTGSDAVGEREIRVIGHLKSLATVGLIVEAEHIEYRPLSKSMKKEAQEI